MKKALFGGVCAVLAILTACSDEGPKQASEPNATQKEETIIRNLPNQDREFLLRPLEGALDDLREVIDFDPGLVDTTIAIEGEGRSGSTALRLSGNDTMKLDARWIDGLRSETHLRYWNDEGDLFFMESDFRTMNSDSSLLERRMFRVYLEEGGEVISTYGKVGFESGKMAKEWRTICPSPEELTHLLRRPYHGNSRP